MSSEAKPTAASTRRSSEAKPTAASTRRSSEAKPTAASTRRSSGAKPTVASIQLNQPTPVAVEPDAAGRPLAVRRARWPEARRVEAIADSWRIDDEWWRKRAIARIYFTVVFDDAASLTVYHDLVADAWFEQRG